MEDKDTDGISILLVDDEKLIRNSFSRELRAEGFTVIAVAGGSEAITELETGQFDLVITDLGLHGIDGFEVLRAVKKNTPQTRVIILTGYADEQLTAKALRLGADYFILKPCEVDRTGSLYPQLPGEVES